MPVQVRTRRKLRRRVFEIGRSGREITRADPGGRSAARDQHHLVPPLQRRRAVGCEILEEHVGVEHVLGRVHARLADVPLGELPGVTSRMLAPRQKHAPKFGIPVPDTEEQNVRSGHVAGPPTSQMALHCVKNDVTQTKPP